MGDKPGSLPQPTRVPPPRADMVFPQIARLELDELLTQLIERAQDVLETQGRLRALLSATQAVSENLSLPLVLTRIVESACKLIGAQYGAIGVVGPDGTLEQFIHTGMGPDDADRIGHLPTGHGILGQLIKDPRPLRLDNLHDHPAATGFPPNHPPMHTFLGVPIRVRDRVFGNIYLTEKTGGRSFTDDDEELLVALAGTAAIAVDHAELYADARARHDALSAAADLASLLPEADNAFVPVAQLARQVADAGLAVVVAADASGRYRVVAADGDGAGAVRGMVVRDADPDSVAMEMRSHGVDVVVTMPMSLTDSTGSPALLLLTRRNEARPFRPTETDAVRVFSEHATAALAQIAARRNAQLIQLLRQRDAIAQEMNDHVVSRLFAAGLALQGIAGRVHDDEVRNRLREETDRLDQIIAIIRTSIFGADPLPPEA